MQVSYLAPVSGSVQATMPVSVSSTVSGTCITMPVSGWIGRIGE